MSIDTNKYMEEINRSIDEIYETNKFLDPNDPYKIFYEGDQVILKPKINTYQYNNSEKNNDINKMKWIVGIVVFVILVFFILVILYIAFIYNYEETEDEDTWDKEEPNTNTGGYIPYTEISTIFKNITSGKQNNECEKGYYGENCEFQFHDMKYYNIGYLNGQYTKIDKGIVNLSFNELTKDPNSCTSLCDNDKNCKGVEYDHSTNHCYLINSDISATGESYMNLSLPTQLYLNKKERPFFSDKVIGYRHSKLLRYYMESAECTGNVIHFPIGSVIKIDWLPTKIVNYGNCIGYYSDTEFTVDNYKNHTMLYVDDSSGSYSTPYNLIKNLPLYVLYIK